MQHTNVKVVYIPGLSWMPSVRYNFTDCSCCLSTSCSTNGCLQNVKDMKTSVLLCKQAFFGNTGYLNLCELRSRQLSPLITIITLDPKILLCLSLAGYVRQSKTTPAIGASCKAATAEETVERSAQFVQMTHCSSAKASNVM